MLTIIVQVFKTSMLNLGVNVINHWFNFSTEQTFNFVNLIGRKSKRLTLYL